MKEMRKWRGTENEAIYMEDVDTVWFWENRSSLIVSHHKLNMCILITLDGKKNCILSGVSGAFWSHGDSQGPPLTRAELTTATRPASALRLYTEEGQVKEQQNVKSKNVPIKITASSYFVQILIHSEKLFWVKKQIYSCKLSPCPT